MENSSQLIFDVPEKPLNRMQEPRGEGPRVRFVCVCLCLCNRCEMAS